MACLAGLFGRVGPAQQALEKAVKLEPALAKDARTDPDFESVRSALAAVLSAVFRVGVHALVQYEA